MSTQSATLGASCALVAALSAACTSSPVTGGSGSGGAGGAALCMAPPCDFVEIASKQRGPRSIVAADDYVYWADVDGGTIMKMPAAGGDAVILASVQDHPVNLAIDSLFAYWTTLQGVMKIPLLNGTLPITIAPLDHGASAAVIDATNIYWVESGKTDDVGIVMKAPLDGNPPVLLADNQSAPVSIAVSATDVYWVSLGSALHACSLQKVPLAGGMPVAVSEQGLMKCGGPLAVDAKNLYWVGGADKAITLLPLAGGAPTNVPVGTNGADLAVDGATLYFTDTSALFKIPIAGGAALTLAKGSKMVGGGPTEVAVNATHVFYTDYIAGSVFAAPK